MVTGVVQEMGGNGVDAEVGAGVEAGVAAGFVACADALAAVDVGWSDPLTVGAGLGSTGVLHPTSAMASALPIQRCRSITSR